VVIITSMFIVSGLSKDIERNERNARVSAYLEQVPTINITGVIDRWKPIDGPSHALVPDEEIDFEMGYRGIYLHGFNLSEDEDLDGKHVRIQGKLLENFVEYAKAVEIPYYGGSPTTATIIVEEIQILNSQK